VNGYGSATLRPTCDVAVILCSEANKPFRTHSSSVTLHTRIYEKVAFRKLNLAWRRQMDWKHGEKSCWLYIASLQQRLMSRNRFNRIHVDLEAAMLLLLSVFSKASLS